MKRRVMFAGVAAIVGLLVPLAAAAPPASAGTGVGCVGTDCSASVWQFVNHTGAWGSSGNTVVPINVPPPPCLWNPIGDATSGSQYIINQFGTVTKQDSLFDVYQSVQQAKKLLKAPEAGTWYELPVNPAAGPGGMAECAKLPLFAFVPPGQAPPMPNVPPVDLAEYAYNHMIIPSPQLTVTPAKAWVNLASYAHLTTPGYVKVTAQLGAVNVWVIARPIKTTISASSAGHPYSDCGLDGSKYSSSPPSTAPGTPPDCGVLWQSPTTDGTVTATVAWRVTWGGSGGGGRLPRVVLDDTVGGLRVAEIQSINGTGGN
jgi:hypothetical protein